MGDKIDQEPENDNAAKRLRMNPHALVRVCMTRLVKLDAIIASPQVDATTRALAVWKVDSVYRALHAVKDETEAPYTHARSMLVDRVFHFARSAESAESGACLTAAKLVTLFPSLGEEMTEERLGWIEAAISDERARATEGTPGHAWASIAKVWKGIEAKDQPWRNWKSAWEKREKALGQLIEDVSAGD